MVHLDRERWAAVIDDNLPPRASWPDLQFRLPALRYPDTLNIAEQLVGSSDAGPSATAIVWREHRLSYRQLHGRVLEAAAALERLGVRPADRVAFRLHNSPDFIVTWLAV